MEVHTVNLEKMLDSKNHPKLPTMEQLKTAVERTKTTMAKAQAAKLNPFQEKLNSLNWAQNAASARTTGSGFPDGKYRTIPIHAKLGTSQSDNLQIHWEWAVTDGEHYGESIPEYMLLSSDIKLQIFAERLAKFGFDPTELETADDIQQALDYIVESKPIVNLGLRTNGQYQNFFVNQVIENEEGEEPPVVSPAKEAAPAPAKAAPAKAKAAPAPVKEAAPAKATPAAKAKAKPAPEPEPEVDDDEVIEEEEEIEEEEVELAVGMTVSFVSKGAEQTGIVTKIEDETSSVIVKVGDKKLRVPQEKLSLVDTELDD